MKLFVLFGQRKEAHPGEYGIEALACATQYDDYENPAYMTEQKRIYSDSEEFSTLGIVTLTVPEAEIEAILQPKPQAITAKVVKE